MSKASKGFASRKVPSVSMKRNSKALPISPSSLYVLSVWFRSVGGLSKWLRKRQSFSFSYFQVVLLAVVPRPSRDSLIPKDDETFFLLLNKLKRRIHRHEKLFRGIRERNLATPLSQVRQGCDVFKIVPTVRHFTGLFLLRNEAKRAVLEAACLLLDDATIRVDEEVSGKNAHVQGRFECVLKRGKKKIR
jgi:hypothetical protein